MATKYSAEYGQLQTKAKIIRKTVSWLDILRIVVMLVFYINNGINNRDTHYYKLQIAYCKLQVANFYLPINHIPGCR